MSGDMDNVTLFAKNLPWEVSEDMLYDVFTTAQDVRIPRREDGKVKGFAFIQFKTEDDVEDAITDKQGADIGGRSVLLDYMGNKSNRASAQQERRSQNKGEPGRTKVLFVKNLNYDTLRDGLLQFFPKALTARIATKPDGRSKGFGFVEFDTAEDAQDAYDNNQGQELDGRQIYMDFASEGGPRRDGGGGRDDRGRDGGGRGGGRFGGGGGGGYRGGSRGGYRGGRGGGGGGGGGGRSGGW